MDWRYARFGDRQIFSTPASAVLAASRAYMSDTLGWSVADDDEGFEARGVSFGRRARAAFRATPAAGGSALRVTVEVDRASAWGFMLLDIGGYYEGQIGLWFEGIGDRLAGRTAATGAGQGPRAAHARAFDALVMVLAGFVFIAFLLNFVVYPVIGLFTGSLYFIGRSGDATLHGVMARIFSAALLLFDAFIAYRLWVFLRPSRPV